jgi:hypothetical protein
LSILASFRTFSTGSIVLLKVTALISSKRAREMAAEKSVPYATDEFSAENGVTKTYLEERVDLDRRLGNAGKGSLCALACAPETTEGSRIALDVEVLLALELGLEVIQKGVVKVLAAKMRITGSGLDGENAARDGKQGDIEGSPSKIEDEDVALRLVLLVGRVEAVGDSGGGRLVDDAENVEAGDDTGILGRQALRVVEVGGDGDDGFLDSLAELGLSSLLELGQNHGRDFGGGEDLGLVEVLDLDGGRPILVAECTLSFARTEAGRRT